ncbi:MAG: hypothetical protein GC129_00435 [Proteobacteria bacterium]|nr:hypothetical protein [Pseudomonadota bacterium]
MKMRSLLPSLTTNKWYFFWGVLGVVLLTAAMTQRVYLGAVAGDPDLQYRYSQRLAQTGHTSEAIVWLEKAAANKVPEALFALGQHYMTDALQHDPSRGFNLIKEAAERGYTPAMTLLAANYEYWPPVKNEQMAFAWYSRAAFAGEEIAMERLAEAYEKGELELKKSPKDAAWWKTQSQRRKP